MSSVSSYRQNQNTHFMSRNFFENSAVCEIMSKNVVEPEAAAMWRIRVACWISKATRAQGHARADPPQQK